MRFFGYSLLKSDFLTSRDARIALYFISAKLHGKDSPYFTGKILSSVSMRISVFCFSSSLIFS